ncbi:S-adenosylmethionine mitochondrial carrier protein homolog isoform X1 [Apis cerana]|uniref:S-adenosylmethionine mitochondrial carrier protein homolog isoform X1 n=1 Tax=Apis cerana TaxID=7461 RepID=UPI002B23D9E3|nr:S-adenosylmethionine mitochondrial carrier protein homolog isoform X1 [Apis cerana]
MDAYNKAGGLAGTVVDIILFPLDTLKTRLQSKQGFIKSGGFFNLYKGIFPVIIGSAPSASLFFVTYESIKNLAQYKIPKEYDSFLHMSSASLAEMVACLIRVPVEVIKQKKQVSMLDRKDINLKMLYCGYWSTVLRDMPFSLIQFPIWEYLKKNWSLHVDREILPIESAICGAIAGGISATATTPFDVIKTRIMLSHRNEKTSKLKILYILKDIYKDKGLQGLFAGVSPRVIWITLGGFIFFGIYEEIKIRGINYCLFESIV